MMSALIRKLKAFISCRIFGKHYPMITLDRAAGRFYWCCRHCHTPLKGKRQSQIEARQEPNP